MVDEQRKPRSHTQISVRIADHVVESAHALAKKLAEEKGVKVTVGDAVRVALDEARERRKG